MSGISALSVCEWCSDRQLRDNMAAVVPSSKEGLTRLAGDVHEGLEELRKSERRMNSNFEHLLADFKNKR